MEIVQYPHPALRWKSKPITEINAQLRKSIAEMFELMYSARGIGLAANQVALPYRVFIMNPSGDPEEKELEYVFINPEIIRRKGSVEGEEGCLSLPELYGQVRRAADIVVEAYDLEGQGFEMKLNELPSRIVQHETDHLDGVLFVDRMLDEAAKELQPKLDDFTQRFRKRQESGEIPGDEELKKRLQELEGAQA